MAIGVPRQYQGVIFYKGSVEPEIEGALLVVFWNLVLGRDQWGNEVKRCTCCDEDWKSTLVSPRIVGQFTIYIGRERFILVPILKIRIVARFESPE